MITIEGVLSKVKVDLNLFKEAVIKILEKAAYENPGKWWNILLELGETEDSEESTSEEIVAKRHNVPPKDVFKAIHLLYNSSAVRNFLLSGKFNDISSVTHKINKLKSNGFTVNSAL
jgi:hypothetical protein